MNEKDKQLHAKVTELLESTHCRKHGMEWEACCFADAVLEIHNKVMSLFITARKEEREAAFRKVEEAVWMATKDFKAILNEVQRRAIALAAATYAEAAASAKEKNDG